ncbi:PREDICTED: uncharacterized protein LOC108354372 [Rhagoletis zephyria]|uniref:uncharacterized protein LOC108354372 n=1 Tax=Rhagoletis zephyria TaxID=28612 RepID=UPI0008116DBC|nr:PREDICTED: uncharacterized protein LOC108354372 [Rhagoletis zephyria]
MIERWHRSLKAALMCHASASWVDSLPVVMLGLRTSYKADIHASAAEMLYGTTLHLPGDYFLDQGKTVEPLQFINDFRDFMRKIRSEPAAHHNKTRAFHHQSLRTCTHVFVRVDEVKQPLQQPYRGPFEILKRISDTVFVVKVEGRSTTLSTERLKPPFVETLPDLVHPVATHRSSSSGIYETLQRSNIMTSHTSSSHSGGTTMATVHKYTSET